MGIRFIQDAIVWSRSILPSTNAFPTAPSLNLNTALPSPLHQIPPSPPIIHSSLSKNPGSELILASNLFHHSSNALSGTTSTPPAPVVPLKLAKKLKAFLIILCANTNVVDGGTFCAGTNAPAPPPPPILAATDSAASTDIPSTTFPPLPVLPSLKIALSFPGPIPPRNLGSGCCWGLEAGGGGMR